MTRRTETSSTALDSLLERSSMLLDEKSPPMPSMSGEQALADPTGVLVEAGWYMLQQLKIALGLTVSGDDADRLVPDLLDRASAFDIASAPSVGAAASIVDQVRTDDPTALARTILAARGAFGDAEIVAGACALITALTLRIAERMALDPLVVHSELARCAAGSIGGCGSTRGRTGSTRRTGSRPWCGAHMAHRCADRITAIPIVLQHR